MHKGDLRITSIDMPSAPARTRSIIQSLSQRPSHWVSCRMQCIKVPFEFEHTPGPDLTPGSLSIGPSGVCRQVSHGDTLGGAARVTLLFTKAFNSPTTMSGHRRPPSTQSAGTCRSGRSAGERSDLHEDIKLVPIRSRTMGDTQVLHEIPWELFAGYGDTQL